MPSQKKFLEELSGTCYVRSTHYRYNKHNMFTEKYGKGRLAAYDYIGQLCHYFIQEEKSIPTRLKEQIEGQMEKHSCLNDSDYKRGEAIYGNSNAPADFLERAARSPMLDFNKGVALLYNRGLTLKAIASLRKNKRLNKHFKEYIDKLESEKYYTVLQGGAVSAEM